MLDLVRRIKCPLVLHFAAEDKFVPETAREQVKAAFAGNTGAEVYVYPGVDHAFARPGGHACNKPAAMMAHSRSIALFRRVMGPHLDLSALWDQHCYHEFVTRDVDATMATMVPEPYVNHVPTLTGGVGQRELARFYRHHFIPTTPADTKLIPISRTIGADRVVDEMLFCFTHDIEIDWMLPGVKPSGKYVEIPLVAIICFRGGKLYNEHIYWDQASVLVQIGALEAKGLPVAGIETAKKLLDESLPSNSPDEEVGGERLQVDGKASHGHQGQCGVGHRFQSWHRPLFRRGASRARSRQGLCQRSPARAPGRSRRTPQGEGDSAEA